MSTTNTATKDTAQELIELRLDTIDRALLGLLPRSERLSLVAQVESRIREAAAATEANQASPGQRAISDSLRSAESAAEAGLTSDGPSFTAVAGRVRPARRQQRSSVAVSSGIVGIVALALLVAMPFTYLLASFFDEFEEAAVAVLGAHVVAVAMGGTAAVVLGIVALVRLNRRTSQLVGHGWAITGLCTGPLPMFVGGLLALCVGVQLLGTASIRVTDVQAYPVAVPGDANLPQCVAPAQYAVPVTMTPDSPACAPAAPMSLAPAPIVGPIASGGVDVCAEECLRQEQAAFDFNNPPLAPTASAPVALPTR